MTKAAISAKGCGTAPSKALTSQSISCLADARIAPMVGRYKSRNVSQRHGKLDITAAGNDGRNELAPREPGVPFSRREFQMKLAWTAGLSAAVSLIAVAAYAQGQPDFSQVQIKTTPLGNNVYMLEGNGGNITVACGQDGAIQVDGEFAPLHDKIKAAVDRACGNKPVKYLVNT